MHRGQPYNRPKEDCCSNLAKVHALDALAAQGRTDWGTWAGLAGADNQLDDLVRGHLASRHDGGVARAMEARGAEVRQDAAAEMR